MRRFEGLVNVEPRVAAADCDHGGHIQPRYSHEAINPDRRGFGAVIMDANFLKDLFMAQYDLTNGRPGADSPYHADAIMELLCKHGRTLIIPEECFAEVSCGTFGHLTMKTNPHTNTGLDILHGEEVPSFHMFREHPEMQPFFHYLSDKRLGLLNAPTDEHGNPTPENNLKDPVRCYGSIDDMMKAEEVNGQYNKGGIVIVRCLPTWRVKRNSEMRANSDMQPLDRPDYQHTENGICHFPEKGDKRALADHEIRREDSALGKGDIAITILAKKLIERAKSHKVKEKPIFPILTRDRNLANQLTSENPTLPNNPVVLEGRKDPTAKAGLFNRLGLAVDNRPFVVRNIYELVAGLCHYGELDARVWDEMMLEKPLAHKIQKSDLAFYANGPDQIDPDCKIASWLMQTNPRQTVDHGKAAASIKPFVERVSPHHCTDHGDPQHRAETVMSL